MRVQLPDVRITDFEPGNSTPSQVAPSTLRRATQRYLVALNRVNKLIADINLSVQLEQLHRRRAKVEDVAQLLERAQVMRLGAATMPQVMYVHDELMELHRSMTSLATLKDTLDNWVILSEHGEAAAVEAAQPASAEEGAR